jgi:hypothetical protein
VNGDDESSLMMVLIAVATLEGGSALENVVQEFKLWLPDIN